MTNVRVRGLGLVLVLLGGCICKKKAPPVHFQSAVDDRPAPVATDAAVAAGSDASAPSFVAIEGEAVPGDGTSLAVDGATIAAPAGERFGAWLKVDLDGDGASADVLATRVSGDGQARALGLYRRNGAAFEEVALAGATPGDARCAESGLRLTSPRSAVVTWRCTAQTIGGGALPSASTEQVLVGLGAAPAVKYRVALGWGDLPDTNLALTLEGSDRDGDGRDELVVAVSAGRPGRPAAATARVVFFERAGAFARDMSEPAASLAAVVDGARRSLAQRRPGVLAALAALEDLQRLRRAFCAESGLVRIKLGTETGVACNAGGTFTAAAELLARTYMNLGELPAAEAQLDPSTASELGAVTSARVRADLQRLTVSERNVTARQGPTLAATVDEVPGAFGAVAFNPAVNPSALTLRGPVAGAIDLATLTYTPAEPAPVASLMATSPDGATRMLGFAETCAGVVAVWCATGAPGCGEHPVNGSTRALPDGARQVLLPVLPSLAFTQRCQQEPGGFHGLASPGLRVLGWSAQGLLVSLDGALHRISAQGDIVAPVYLGDALGVQYPTGSAVDERGGVVVLPAANGAWVRSRTAWKLWTTPEMAGRGARFAGLTVTPDARLVAGLVGAQVWILERAQPATRQR
jgi:hypothetical protein